LDISLAFNELYYTYKAQLAMLLDKNRTLKYKYAIFEAVRPGDVVIDFGCGTGILGFFALQAGARRVYAIEETSIIDYARQLAIKNEYQDKIIFIHKSAKAVTEQDIPEQVDAILSEPFSNLLLEGDLWSSLEYLKQFLKSEGVILPQSGTLYIVPVRFPPRAFQEMQLLEGKNIYNIDFEDLTRAIFYNSTLTSDAWLAKPQPLLHFQLFNDKLTDFFQKSIEFDITRAGRLYGVELFFEANISHGSSLSSREQGEYSAWMPLFAPSLIQPTFLSNDHLQITVETSILNLFRQIWSFTFKHYSQLLPSDAQWWKTKTAVPKLAPKAILHLSELIILENNTYISYKCNSELETEFIKLFPNSLNCNEICQIIYESKSYNLNYEDIWKKLIELLHKLLEISLISLPIPKNQMVTKKFVSQINIP